MKIYNWNMFYVLRCVCSKFIENDSFIAFYWHIGEGRLLTAIGLLVLKVEWSVYLYLWSIFFLRFSQSLVPVWFAFGMLVTTPAIVRDSHFYMKWDQGCRPATAIRCTGVDTHSRLTCVLDFILFFLSLALSHIWLGDCLTSHCLQRSGMSLWWLRRLKVLLSFPILSGHPHFLFPIWPHSQIAYKLSIALIELRPEEAPRVRKQSRGSPVRRCNLAGPSLTTIKNRSGTNFSFLSPLYLSYFLSTLLSSHLLLSFYLPCIYILYISYFYYVVNVCECLTNDLLMRAYFSIPSPDPVCSWCHYHTAV